MSEKQFGEDFDYDAVNCKIIYTKDLTSLEVKKWPEIFFSDLEYETCESKIIDRIPLKLKTSKKNYSHQKSPKIKQILTKFKNTNWNMTITWQPNIRI